MRYCPLSSSDARATLARNYKSIRGRELRLHIERAITARDRTYI